MKDSWASETVIQEASLAMELPASPATASQFSNSTATGRPVDQELPSRTISKELSPSNTLDHSKPKEDCDSQTKTNYKSMAHPMLPPNQNQPMDITENVEYVEDEEQIVPQSIASCKVSRPNSSEMTFEETETVSSRIMKMGLRDLLNEVDHEGNIKSDKSKSPNEVNSSTTSYQQKKKMAATWLGSQQQHHAMFGPLSRPTTLNSNNHNTTPVSGSQIRIKEREGSQVITHKKFDYQKKLTLYGQQNTTSAPLNLSKPSPSHFTQSTSDVKIDPAPIDLTTTKKQNKTEYVQSSSFQNPQNQEERKTEHWPSAKKNQDYLSMQSRGFRSHFLFGIKPEPDHYAAPRMPSLPSFWLPRSSSCSPSSASDHSSSSTASSTEQRSEPETSDIKPSPEMLSHLRLDGNTAPPQLSRIDQDIPMLPRVVPFDPLTINNFYMQQFAAANIKGGIYPVPIPHFGGYATATVSPPQPSSPSSKNQKPDKMFICQECGAVFKHRHHVVRHMRSHSGERPFCCDECGATFARKCILTNHKRTHTGEKPYICTECGDTFSRKHHLVIHRRTHTGEKPYKCLHCGAAFARSHHLNRHRKTHVKIDAQSQEEINRMYFAQMPSGFPPGLQLQGIQGLPTMMPILSPNLLPRAMETTQRLSEQSPGDTGDSSQGGFEQGTCETNLEVSEKSTSDDLGAKDTGNSKCQSLSA